MHTPWQRDALPRGMRVFIKMWGNEGPQQIKAGAGTHTQKKNTPFKDCQRGQCFYQER